MTQAGEKALDREYNFVVFSHAFEEHGEFIPAEPRDGVDLANHAG